MRKQSIFVGDVFTSKKGDKCKVVNYIASNKIEVEFYGYKRSKAFYSSGDLKRGNIKDPYMPRVYGVGYLGVGDIKSWENGKATEAYMVWVGMLRRCYAQESMIKAGLKSYIGCYVCDDWLCFAVFAKWYTEHESYGLGYQLDKDLMVRGNKVYSPETCCMLPSQLNSIIIVKSGRNSSGYVGVSKTYNGKYLACVSIDGEVKKLGVRDFAEEASKDYVKAKESHVKEKALEWRDKIGKREFDALMRWRVYG